MRVTELTTPDKPHAVFEAPYVKYEVLQTHENYRTERGNLFATWRCRVTEPGVEPHEAEVFVTDITKDKHLKLTKCSSAWCYTYGIGGHKPEVWDDGRTAQSA